MLLFLVLQAATKEYDSYLELELKSKIRTGKIVSYLDNSQGFHRFNVSKTSKLLQQL